MSSLEAVFFDAGNTLLLLNYGVIARALAQEGVSAAHEALMMAEGRARVRLDPLLAAGQSTEGVNVLKIYARFILEELKLPWDRAAERAFERISTYNRDVGLWNVPNPQAPAVLEELKGEGSMLGVVSNSDGSVERLLQQAGLADFFSFILDSGDVGVEKPDPRIFRLALERAGVKPERAVHIGDFYSVDVLGAQAAGVRGILLDPVGAWAGIGCLKARDLADALKLIHLQHSL
ncbi:MAG: HAD-IA family hydrolase [candidate division NC10 bacterium]|nr:HAD-IA family hydrolase [candidate division NC10 bacterium]